MLTQLRRIVESVANAATLTDALNDVVRLVCEAIHVDCCSVYLSDAHTKTHQLVATQGLNRPKIAIRLSFGEGLVGLVGLRSEPIRVEDAPNHPNFKAFPQLKEQAFRAFLGTPIIHQGQVLGIFVLQQKQTRQFTDLEESFAVTLAAQLASKLAHTKAQGHWFVPTSSTLKLTGITAVSGIGIGVAHCLDEQTPESIFPASCLDVSAEKKRFLQALESTRHAFSSGKAQLNDALSTDLMWIFDWYVQILDDTTFQQKILSLIAQYSTAEWAIERVISEYQQRFLSMSDPYLQARQFDILEIGQRLLCQLQRHDLTITHKKTPHVLCVRHLTALLLSQIDADSVLALVAKEGAENSHAAILAKAMNIPTLLGVDFDEQTCQGHTLVVDGNQGELFIAPPLSLLSIYREQQEEDRRWQRQLSLGSTRWGRTQDGVPIDICLNLTLSRELQLSDKGIDGVGLYRTEMPFLLSHGFPSEEVQYLQYQRILRHYGKKRVVMRTLDIGGDKPLPYFPIAEDNPFLGWRGMRFTLDHPEIFLVQLRAMLKASVDHANLDILLPMISSLSELQQAKNWVDKAVQEVTAWARERKKTLHYPKLGVMVEIPALMYQLPVLPDYVDFVSVGSNDLTQYLLAVDRNNAQVSGIFDAYHPSILIALRYIQQECDKTGRPVTICGELAGDPLGAALLVGLGYRRLSMNRGNMAAVKYVLRHLPMKDLQHFAQAACLSPSSTQLQSDWHAFLACHQLTRMLRGKNT